jgi:CBS domain-containing protein
MVVAEFMRREIVAVAIGDTLARAAEQMRTYDVSALPVLNGTRMVGIITERDMAHAIAARTDPDVSHVSASMTPEPLAVSPAHTASEAVLIMIEHHIRHLPVMDCGELVGMVSVRDLLPRERDSTARRASRTAGSEAVALGD